MKTVRLKISDRVRVSETMASEYAGASGVIVAIEQRQAGVITLAEYEVELKDAVRRRFLGFQLTRLAKPLIRHRRMVESKSRLSKITTMRAIC
jgi:hypothetical protein